MAANEVTFSVNASDVTRYATKPGDALWPPFLCHPLATTIVSIFGILVTSSSSVILGEVATPPQAYPGTLLIFQNDSWCGIQRVSSINSLPWIIVRKTEQAYFSLPLA
jgi:hypothetical protein